MQEIANLHARIFLDGAGAGPGLRDYYDSVFLRNPWRSEDFPSLVYEDDRGRLRGFVGVLPRPILLRGRPARMVVCHRLMVDPDMQPPFPPFLGARLLKQVFSGPQDFTWTDGANNEGRLAWQSSGGRTQAIASLSWLRIFRPTRYLCNLAIRGRVLTPVARGARPVAKLLDLAIDRLTSQRLRPDASSFTESELDDGQLLDAIERATSNASVKPVYDGHTLGWLLELLAKNTRRGRFLRRGVHDGNGALVGWYVGYANDGGQDEVLQVGAIAGDVGPVIDHLVSRASSSGAIAIRGKVEPRLLDALVRRKCLFASGHNWALFHGRDAGVLESVSHPSAFLSGLEGEMCLYSPRHEP